MRNQTKNNEKSDQKQLKSKEPRSTLPKGFELHKLGNYFLFIPIQLREHGNQTIFQIEIVNNDVMMTHKGFFRFAEGGGAD